MGTNTLLDKEVQELGYDDFFTSKVRVEYQSTSDIVTIEANGRSLLLGMVEAQEIAIALATFVKYYGSIEKEKQLNEIMARKAYTNL